MSERGSREFDPQLFESYQASSELARSGLRDSEWRLNQFGIWEFLSPEAEVLDVGSNEGLMSIIIGRRVKSVTGIEIHAPFVEKSTAMALEAGVTNCEFICAPFSKSLIEGRKFDLILSLAAHYWMEDLRGYLRELKSLLADRGRLLIESHNLKEAHHAADWEIVKAETLDMRCLKSGSFEEEISYKRGAGSFSREFLLLGLIP